MTLELYASGASCSMAAHILLEEIDADYVVHSVDLAKAEHKQPSFLALNPVGKLPLLRTPHGLVSESVALARYIVEVAERAQSGAPDEPSAPATALEGVRWQEWMNRLSATVHPIFSLAFAPQRFVDTDDAQVELRRKAVERYRELLNVVEADLPERGWVMGDYSAVDPQLLVVWMWGRYLGLSRADYPKLARWETEMRARPAVRRVLQAQGIDPDN